MALTRLSNPMGLRGGDPAIDSEPATLTIESIEIDPENPQSGDEVNVTVTASDAGTATSEWVSAVVILDSPQLSGEPIWACRIMPPGGTDTFTTEDPHNGSGEFQLPSGPVDLTATVGGFVDGTHCTDQRDVMSVDDERTLTISQGISLEGCTITPTTISSGGAVSFEQEVRNAGSQDVTVEVTWAVGSTQVRQTATIPANSTQMVSTQESINQTGDHTVTSTISVV